MAISSMAKEHHLLDILSGFQADFLAQEQVFLGGRETPSDSPVEAPQKWMQSECIRTSCTLW